MLKEFKKSLRTVLGLKKKEEVNIELSEEDLEKPHIKRFKEELDSDYVKAIDTRNEILEIIEEQGEKKDWSDEVKEAVTNLCMAVEIQRRKQLERAGYKVV